MRENINVDRIVCKMQIVRYYSASYRNKCCVCERKFVKREYVVYDGWQTICLSHVRKRLDERVKEYKESIAEVEKFWQDVEKNLKKYEDNNMLVWI